MKVLARLEMLNMQRKEEMAYNISMAFFAQLFLHEEKEQKYAF